MESERKYGRAVPEGSDVSHASLLCDKQVAAILGIKPHSLAVWRCTKRHDLPFIRIGRTVRYRLADVLAFIDRRAAASSAEHAVSGRETDGSGRSTREERREG